MVKLDVSLLRYLSQEDFKVLTSVEMGMRNHELVPGTLVNSIATLRFGGCGKLLVDLTKHKLLAYERGKRYDGYRLTYAGYDYLALNVLTHRDVLGGVGNQIGVGKESDVFICESPDQQNQYAIKLHRLGRVCFRKVSEKRDFYTKSKNKTSWIYLSRKAAQREFEFLRFMHLKGMPVPKPIDCNRHVVVMELIDGRLLNHYTMDSFELDKRDRQIAALYKNLMDLIFRFANETRVIHGDFNEFNILIKHNDKLDELEPVIIDLPQMIGVDHDLAPEQFERDVNCIVEFFNKRFHYESDYIPVWADIADSVVTKEEDKLDKFLQDALRSINNDDEYTSKPASTESNDINLIQKIISEKESHHDDSSNSENEENELVDKIDECLSQFTTMTVDPLEARRRLRSEIIKRENGKKKRDAGKPKNIKEINNNEPETLDLWSPANEALLIRDQEGYNFIEVSKLPKKIDGRSLTSLIVSASKVVPLSTNMCLKDDNQRVAIVEFPSERDAYMAIDKIKASAFGAYWNIKIIRNPNYIKLSR